MLQSVQNRLLSREMAYYPQLFRAGLGQHYARLAQLGADDEPALAALTYRDPWDEKGEAHARASSLASPAGPGGV